MQTKKTLQLRERELQSLLATPEGKKELLNLVDLYSASGERMRPERNSIITFILVYERVNGLIEG